MNAPHVIPNDIGMAGRPASRRVAFGEFARYEVFAVHTRFQDVQWFVTDRLQKDELGMDLVIRQTSRFTDAIKGLAR